MRRFIKGAAIAAAIGVGAAGFGQSTTNDYTPTNLSLRIGAAWPLDDNLSDISDVLFAAGVDWRLDRPFFAGGETYFSLDWFGRSTSGQNGNVFPVCINHKWFTSGTGLQTAEDRRTYFFAGVGAFFVDVGSSDTVIGARGGLGLELGPYFFAEVAGYISDKTSTSVRGPAIAAYVGYKF